MAGREHEDHEKPTTAGSDGLIIDVSFKVFAKILSRHC